MKYERSYDLKKWTEISESEVRKLAGETYQDADLFICSLSNQPSKLTPFSWVRCYNECSDCNECIAHQYCFKSRCNCVCPSDSACYFDTGIDELCHECTLHGDCIIFGCICDTKGETE